ncbi:hypothetical protein B1748_25385 [Paenibacillus sp. MY03]|uniref:extracellular solute-binding protein n=1 Tax=Paenibacillus sp. MY03 TaxID=302980 RepID=UPI000B3D4AF2|nr:extracellular solute-binding protein [Paenibacillus sp. MY03]OUS72190.1 hypothetical protein B1748_25385 [Paenibacillus sp. MY03]
MNRDQPQPGRKNYQLRLQNMIDHLRSDILNGVYAPGDLLPSELKLTKLFQLSNKSARKGLDALVEEGLIVKVDRVGSRVTEQLPGFFQSISFGYSSSIERDFALPLLIEDFRKLHPTIRVKALPLQSVSNYLGTVKDYMNSGLLDVCTINNLDFQHLEENDDIDMLQPLVPQTHTYRFAQRAFTQGQTLLAQPIVFSPLVLAYHRTHFQEANVPEPDGSWTWQDIIQHAHTLAVPGQRHGFYFYLLSDNRWPVFLLQSCMDFAMKQPGAFRLHGTPLLESIRLCKELINNREVFPRYLSESNDDVNELFLQGKVSMILTTYTSLNDFKDLDIQYDISPVPYLFEPRTLLNVIGVAVNRNSKQPQAAAAFSDYLASARAQRILRNQTISLPALKPVAEEPLEDANSLNRPSRYDLFRETISSFRMNRDLNMPLHSFFTLKTILKQYWSEFIDEEALCGQVEELLNSPSAKGGVYAEE